MLHGFFKRGSRPDEPLLAKLATTSKQSAVIQTILAAREQIEFKRMPRNKAPSTVIAGSGYHIN